ncbi:anti-sigma B factor antagonist [Thermomonospora echinospora]|uniref:Anti-sigma factor antagonist n=1 Tax=Thermomonospora echinospora TaxID=1992 RepID=A0A1H5TNZ4_9ACTN|nr:STAS domain-containing protein [Thermomonospora echinospora]SEF63821.1 anti-sigma B factor antagonist [Thermomonospora echinospora]
MTEHELTTTLRLHPAGPHVLTVTGELDHHTAPRLRTALEEIELEAGSALVIDLSAVTYCDSTGITVLVTAYHRTQAEGASLALAGLTPDLTRVFTVVGLDQIFSFHPTAEDAVRALKS